MNLIYCRKFLEDETHSDSIKNCLIELMIEDPAPSERWKEFDDTIENIDVRKVITDALLNLELKKIDREIDEIKSRISSADEEILDRLLQRQNELTQKRNLIYQKLLHN